MPESPVPLRRPGSLSYRWTQFCRTIGLTIIMRYLTLGVVAFTLASCSRDPNYLKKSDVERGNTFMKAGKTREAEIMYKKAIQVDRKYGEAYYQLARAYLQDNS